MIIEPDYSTHCRAACLTGQLAFAPLHAAYAGHVAHDVQCHRGDGVVLSNSQQSIALAEMSAIEV
ncbi:hypothetical protein [Xanthomonas arboricola]|uniref:hypothetical protein n=1 Tax=Xanthomonas arboricola TaxID=56448 RepID=UPI001C85A955|nr:hypothetical protein [Xanthomonas arboricola]